MTFPITESIIKSADNLTSANSSVMIILILIFIAVSVISGILTYKIKIKKLRKNHKENENTDKAGKG